MPKLRPNVLSERLPDALEIENAQRALDILESLGNERGMVRTGLPESQEEGSPIVLIPALTSAFLEMLRTVPRGHGFTLVPLNQELTAGGAADHLNVSRQYVMHLLERGELRYRLVGRYRRIPTKDLLAYVERRRMEREEALSALAALDQESGQI